MWLRVLAFAALIAVVQACGTEPQPGGETSAARTGHDASFVMTASHGPAGDDPHRVNVAKRGKRIARITSVG